jgi:hypothetical protein
MAKGDVVVKADRIRTWHKMGKYIKLALLILLLILIVIFLVLKVFFSDGSFSVSIDNNDMLYSGLAMYESRNDPMPKRILTAKDVQFMDNISIKWLPSNIDIEAEGSHNGENYVAYTFFIENQGNLMFNYWYNVSMRDVIRNADEALRIMIIVNGEKNVYAKASPLDGSPECAYYGNRSQPCQEKTTPFRTDEDGTIILQKRANMQPGEFDRITVVIWIEGDDPECLDPLIGGRARLDMKIIEEHTEESIKDLDKESAL